MRAAIVSIVVLGGRTSSAQRPPSQVRPSALRPPRATAAVAARPPVPAARVQPAKPVEVVPRVAFVPVRRSITNDELRRFVKTERDVLEVVVPANTGHVYFRVGDKVYDFFEGGLRIGGVRPIKSERYGFLVRLSPGDLTRLRAHLDRLERTRGAELGAYDFNGEKGFHCVSWIARLPIGRRGENIVELLGGVPTDGQSMPAFARFLADHVPEQIVYSQNVIGKVSLDAMPLRIMTIEELVAAHAARPR